MGWDGIGIGMVLGTAPSSHAAGLQPAGKALSPSSASTWAPPLGKWEIDPRLGWLQHPAPRDALGRLCLYLLTSSSSPQTCQVFPRSQPCLGPAGSRMVSRILEGSGRALSHSGCPCDAQQKFLIPNSITKALEPLPRSVSSVLGFEMQKWWANRPVWVSAAFSARVKSQRAGDRAGIKGIKLGCTTLLDVRSPLISQTFPIRKKKPEAFAYQKRIFDLSLLCFSPPSPPWLEEPCQHYRNSICKTICKAGVEYILLFKKQIFHIMSCGDFCDVAFFFYVAYVQGMDVKDINPTNNCKYLPWESMWHIL